MFTYSNSASHTSLMSFGKKKRKNLHFNQNSCLLSRLKIQRPQYTINTLEAKIYRNISAIDDASMAALWYEMICFSIICYIRCGNSIHPHKSHQKRITLLRHTMGCVMLYYKIIVCRTSHKTYIFWVQNTVNSCGAMPFCSFCQRAVTENVYDYLIQSSVECVEKNMMPKQSSTIVHYVACNLLIIRKIFTQWWYMARMYCICIYLYSKNMQRL